MSNRQPPHRRPLRVAGLAKILATLIDHARALVLIPILIIVVAAAGYWGWRTAWRTGLTADEYRLTPEDIKVCTASKWIDARRLKASVIQDASLDQPMSILDRRLTARIASAFAAHPWVARVARVEKFHPASVEVDLVYREPVAVVVTQARRIPVDSLGVRLPSEDFTPDQLQAFPAILGIGDTRRDWIGNAWGDPRVAGAAQIAAALVSDWADLDLAGIVPSQMPVDGANVFRYELRTRQGTRVPWGRQYLTPHETEPTAAEKSQRLKRYAEIYGTLDGLSQNWEAERNPSVGAIPHQTPRN
ncbi:MAG: hypothetical protein GTO53_12615 [Planctomycetales bacterium]|nr:hypothetical protein [Planctomycetales bacterium]NIM09946.1 hypothetical protein [Planctomycetales bacterium]NIN09386.1 hypothetical protein [Planctomycetales bacterium]NIN78493.1 hypothetical protein [Planctomycetales bacterium]NIO35685.1 hypothetical protein [Planctomycetales bacterium]